MAVVGVAIWVVFEVGCVWRWSVCWTGLIACCPAVQLDCENLEGMPWYRSLLMYGCRQQVVDAADIDVNLLSSVVEKVVFPKLTCTSST